MLHTSPAHISRSFAIVGTWLLELSRNLLGSAISSLHLLTQFAGPQLLSHSCLLLVLLHLPPFVGLVLPRPIVPELSSVLFGSMDLWCKGCGLHRHLFHYFCHLVTQYSLHHFTFYIHTHISIIEYTIYLSLAPPLLILLGHQRGHGPSQGRISPPMIELWTVWSLPVWKWLSTFLEPMVQMASPIW